MDTTQYFNRSIKEELAKSEQKRLFITSLILGIGFIDLLLINIFVKDAFINFFDNRLSYIIIYLWILIFLLFELSRYLIVRSKIRAGKGAELRFSKYILIGEITYLNLVLFLVLTFEKKAVTIDSPIIFILFILLIISSLRLDFDYSLIAGIVAALEYLIIVVLAVNVYSPGTEFELKLPSIIYYYRSIFLAVTGFTAGFVAREIKRGMYRSLNNLNEKRKIEFLFGQQVEPEVVNTLVKETHGSKLTEVTILFFDVRDFTRLAEKRTPDEIIHFQNTILSPIIDIIHSKQGIVNQILGDGLMVTFGAPSKLTDHAQKAFDAALAIRQKIKEMIISGEIPEIGVRLGLHSGPVVAGNIGPESRKQFSISGTPVIIAARLEQLNKKYGSEILISGEVEEKIYTSVPLTPKGVEYLKGIEKGIKVFMIE